MEVCAVMTGERRSAREGLASRRALLAHRTKSKAPEEAASLVSRKTEEVSGGSEVLTWGQAGYV